MFVKKMLEIRGYESIKKIDNGYTFSDSNKDSILLHYKDISINSVAEIKNKTDKYYKVIIVKSGKITPAANSALKDLESIKDLELFDISELEFCPIEHQDCPKYSLLSIDEGNQLLKMYRSTKMQLPRMIYGDPIRRYYGWKKGSIIREDDGNGLYYRLIV